MLVKTNVQTECSHRLQTSITANHNAPTRQCYGIYYKQVKKTMEIDPY